MRRANVLATILFVPFITLVSFPPASADTTSLVGKPAPDFSLTTLDGKVAKLSAQKGNVVVICFWRTSDSDQPLIRDVLPFMQQLSANQNWASNGLVVWGITVNEPKQTAVTVRKFLKDHNFTFDVLYDDTSAASRSYLVPGTPTTLVIGSDGIIKYVIGGFGNARPHEISAAVERALAESGKLDAAAFIGSPAPAFLLTAPNGAAIHLDDDKYEHNKHKVVLITFWADGNSSASILRHIQELAANRNFVGRGLTVMAVATGRQTPGDVRKFLLDNRYTFEVLFDTAFASWEDSLGKEMTTFVIGYEGVVTNVFAGASAGLIKQIDEAVASALDEPAVPNPLSLIGKPAPDFSLTTLDGKTVRLSDQRGKVVLLDFWASWCYPCEVTLPHTQALSDNRDLANKGLVVWAVTGPDNKQGMADAKRFVLSRKFTFAAPADTKDAVKNAYGVWGIPTAVIVGRDGLIKSVVGGNSKVIDDSIASALAESRPALPSNVQPNPPPAPSGPPNQALSPLPPPAPPTPANPAAPSSAPARNWNESRLDARIETPLGSPNGITCGGVLGTASSFAGSRQCS
jgi:peroxiredoxin